MKILGPPVITFLFFVIFTGLIIQYWTKLSKRKIWFKLFLFSLRTLTLSILLFLLLNPWIKWLNIEMEPQKITAIIDNSQSMQYHLENIPLTIKEVSKKLYKWEDKNSIDLSISTLEEINNTPSAAVTDFSSIPSFIRKNNPRQVLVLTDGMATRGKELSNLNLPEHIPMHTIGVGPVLKQNDIRIENVYSGHQFSPEDTVFLNIDISSHVNVGTESLLELINGNGEIIYQDKLEFNEGYSERKTEIKLPAYRFSQLNVAALAPLTKESQISNNTFSFRINMNTESEQVLMISGGLSPNTAFIKDCLSVLEDVELEHLYKTTVNNWKKEFSSELIKGAQLIVLDDFPAFNIDLQIFREVTNFAKQAQLPIIYIEGPHSNIAHAGKLNTAFPFLRGLPIDPEVEISIDLNSNWIVHNMAIMEKFPPQKRNVKWETDSEAWLKYEDNSQLCFQKDNFFFIGIPELMGSHLKLQQNEQSPLKHLTETIIMKAYHQENGLLQLSIPGESFSRGEKISGKIQSVSHMPVQDLILVAENTSGDTLSFKCRNSPGKKEYDCPFSLSLAGEYRVSAQGTLPDGTQIFSNTHPLIIQDVNLELQDLVQNISSLKIAAHSTGGNYASIDSLDSLLANLEINPVRVEKNLHISGLSTQSFWWILIVLLALEWYFRKDIGLL